MTALRQAGRVGSGAPRATTAAEAGIPALAGPDEVSPTGRVGSGAHRAEPVLGLASGETRGTAAEQEWRWYNGLRDADPQRQPLKPTLLGLDGAFSFETLADLAGVVAGLLDGAAPQLTRAVATFPDFDTFPAFTVRAAGADPRATPSLCTVAVQKTPRDVLEAEIRKAQGGAR